MILSAIFRQDNNTETYQCSQKIDEHEEPHGETAETEQLWQEHQFAKVVYRRVNPPTPLGQQDAPRFRSDSVCDGVRGEFRLEGREVLHHERGEETIFTKGEQVLLVERVDHVLRVFIDDTTRDDDRTTLVGGTDAVHGETTGQTGDGAKQTLEGLGQVVRNVVLVDLESKIR